MTTHHLGFLPWFGDWVDVKKRAEALAGGQRFTVSVDVPCRRGEDPDLPDRSEMSIGPPGREQYHAVGGLWRWVSGPDDLKSGGRTAEIDVNYERVLEMSDERQRPQQGAHASTTPQVAGSLPLEPTYPDGTGAGVGADVWSFQHD